MSDAPWTVGRLLKWTTEYLEKQNADSPRLDAEILLAQARSCKRIDLYAAFEETPAEEVRTAFRELVRRRAAGSPVAYLVGYREFYSLEFMVTPEVLIPRPETEMLVVALLDFFKAAGRQAEPVRVADVGTGSGVLAVCAAKHLPAAQVTAIDISTQALAIAQKNAERHEVAERITFVESDLFQSLPEDQQFDCIVSNPPYISTSEMETLPVDVKDYEPHLALEAGPKGTEIIEQLGTEAAQRLASGGALMIEISPMIAKAVQEILLGQGTWSDVQVIADLAGHARVVQAIRSGNS